MLDVMSMIGSPFRGLAAGAADHGAPEADVRVLTVIVAGPVAERGGGVAVGW
ncbi:hypothetical protein ACFO1B_19210 [Dactylosporangium siamense]|uniref:Uncharacterized protein n=1 Tax=Dactylosporangium siamense TaxID=685454 RepID=A0A919PL34_9ACTN|nr:hypothetical protein [Dactylosporangium siamense]GIG44013.1 hypothetical protein Dsi01nite_020540 [Dactylosporangium siamense]